MTDRENHEALLCPPCDDLPAPEIGWVDLVRPATVSVILGKKGSGKSGLAYYLADLAEKEYQLQPIVVNLHPDRQSLLPPNYGIATLDEIKDTGDLIAIIDEGTTMIPAGGQKLEEIVKGFSALSRQRNQVLLFIFHASSDAGSRVLRGVDNIFLKEPSLRQIQHGAKDAWWKDLLVEAKQEFRRIREVAGNPKPMTCLKCREPACPACPKEHVFVDSEEPEFRGFLKNGLADFWSHELSCAWAGVAEPQKSSYNKPMQDPTEIPKYAHIDDITRTRPPGMPMHKWLDIVRQVEYAPRPRRLMDVSELLYPEKAGLNLEEIKEKMDDQSKERYFYALRLVGLPTDDKTFDCFLACYFGYRQEDLRELIVREGLSDAGRSEILCASLIKRALEKAST